jgi:hypothetical protein
MKKILVVTDLPVSAVNWYRGTGTYQYLGECQTSSVMFHGWEQMVSKDVLVYLRPSTADSLKTIQHAKAMKKTVIVDYDDDFFNISESSPAYQYIIREECQTVTLESAMLCDHLTVSTLSLKESFVNKGVETSKIHVVPNAWDDYYRSFNPKLNLTEKFFMRGDRNAYNDIMSQFYQIRKASTKYEFITLGEVTDFYFYWKMKSYHYITVPFYFDKLADNFFQSRVMIKPMINNVFNRAKSNCSWIEATAAGMVLVASKLPEFNREGIETAEDFYQSIEKLMKHESYAKNKFEKSVDYINENLLLSKVNEQRKKLIEGV